MYTHEYMDFAAPNVLTDSMEYQNESLLSEYIGMCISCIVDLGKMT